MVFPRTVQSLVWVSSVLPLERCSAVLQDELPPGAYVDPEELSRLQVKMVIMVWIGQEKSRIERF